MVFYADGRLSSTETCWERYRADGYSVKQLPVTVSRRQISTAEVNRNLRELRDQRAKDRLANYSEPRTQNGNYGRPPMVLDPLIAQALLQDLAAGCSYRWASRKYRVSDWWVSAAQKDGRLTKMAEGLYGKPTRY